MVVRSKTPTSSAAQEGLLDQREGEMDVSGRASRRPAAALILEIAL